MSEQNDVARQPGATTKISFPSADSRSTGHDSGALPEESQKVETDRTEIKDFVAGLRFDEIKNGDWFAKLLTVSLVSYARKVDAQYFQAKYQGVPADAIVDQRIKLAARYASIEGGLSAAAYTGAVIATLGTAGGASPVAVPAAVGTIMIDLAYTTQLQLRLAYDIAVLYRVPLDVNDPEDLWKIIRVAFAIKGGELAREGSLKYLPLAMRPLIKRFYSGPVLAAGRSLPVVGKFLLQRNVIKVGIPLVGVPLAIGLNRWTTVVAGRHARGVFRNDARVLEIAEKLIERSRHRRLLLWVAWLVVNADGTISDDEALLLRHLARVARDRHNVVEEQLARVIEIDSEEILARIAIECGDLTDLAAAAETIASVDGETNAKERALLKEIQLRCERE